MTVKLLGALATAIASCLAADPNSALTVIARSCTGCHGAAAMSGLDLRTREGALKGGSRGAAIIPGKPADSLLYKAVLRQGDVQMPPGKAVLPLADVEALRGWIAAGAPWSGEPAKTGDPGWWSFKAPKRPEVPGAHGNAVDAFIRDQLRKKGLHPSPEAGKRTLARRAYLDLHGIPPAPEELDAFLADASPDAYAKLIERLLASPRYGERWGRRWLDVVRYADTGGYETDILYKNAWRYRDYVIDSFNQDKPYNIFVQEQIAGDELWPGDLEREGGYFIPKRKLANFQRRIGTALFTFGPMNYEYGLDGAQYRAEWQADAVETTAAAFLGLSMGCARCHDHKFDPLTQKDYYRLAAVFAGSEDREVSMVGRYGEFEHMRFIPLQQKADQIKALIQALDGKVKTGHALTPEEKDKRETLLRQLGEAYLRAPKPIATANILTHSDIVPDTHVLTRGEYSQKGEVVGPGVPAILANGTQVPDRQRRKALALWLTRTDHPLLGRVMINRLWQGHFGRGLVATPNDFGRQGDQPSHPELLDWLAVEFADSGWSMKQMHRLIMLSETYRQSSAPNAANSQADADNIYLWRMNRRRLEAEEIRDSVLAVSGLLNPQMSGPPVALKLSREEMEGIREPNLWPTNIDPAQQNRRSVYLFVKRAFRLPMFEVFDSPDTAQSCARRDVSTVAPQALTLLNSGFTQSAAEALAARTAREPDPVQAIWRSVLGRAPDVAEKSRADGFLNRRSLAELSLLVLNLNEFLYVD